MDNLRDLAAVIASSSDGKISLTQGTVGRKDGEYFVAVGGSKLACTWIDTITVASGDKVLVAIQQPKTGTGTAIVLGRLTAKPRPQYATTLTSPSGSATVKVKDAAGETFEAVWLGDTPPVSGTIVALLWQGSTPIVLGKRRVASTETDDDVNTLKPIEPPKPTVTDVYVRATDSATSQGSFYWEQPGKGLVCGRWGSYPANMGLWFYGAGTQRLAGCSSLQIYVPARDGRRGWYNRPATVIFDLHGHSSRPSRPALRGYSHAWTCPSGWSGGWVDLPGGWCATLAAGGGVAIRGGDYAGFSGVGSDTSSGQLHGR